MNIAHYLPHNVHRYFYRKKNKERYKGLKALRYSESAYSLRSYDRHKVIFIHIPKSAGVSVCTSLFGNLGGGHTTADDYEIVYSSLEFHSYFKFSFVRNPWDRLYSAYRYLKAGGMNAEDKAWAHNHLRPYETFESFVLNWVNPLSVNSYIHFVPQHKFIVLSRKKEICVDFLGRFENLESDFSEIIERCPSLNESALEKLNASEKNRTYFRDAYSSNMSAIVEKAYAEDITLFGYKFN